MANQVYEKRFMKKVSVSILFILMFPGLVQAADVRAYVDRTNISVGESCNLTVAVSGGDADVDVSSIRDFKVTSRGTSTRVRIVNGKMSREISYNYMLMPLRKGRLIIPPLPVVSDGKNFNTQAITVMVSKLPPTVAGHSDMYVRATISEKKPYEGQQIIYTFRLYTTVQIANAKFQKPDFSGFTAKEIGDAKTFQKVVSGQRYTVSELSYVLVPLKPGQVVIDPGTFSCDVVRHRQGRRHSVFDSFFNDPFFGRAEVEPKILNTEPLDILIRPLPAFSGDTDFSGLVGRFEIQAELENNTIDMGDSTTLTLTIAGNGNIMDAQQPKVTIPDAFKVYEDNPEEQVAVNASGFYGKKVFRIALVAVKPGIYSLDPVKISYFDVSKEKYRTLSTKNFTLTSNPSKEKESVQAFSASADRQPVFKKKKVEFTGRDILSLKEDLGALENSKSVSFMVFIILYMVPVVLYLTLFVALKFFKKSEDPGTIMAQRAEIALKQASKMDPLSEDFLACLYRALVSSIYATAGIKGESLTYEEAEVMLVKGGYPNETGKQAAELLQKIESAKYGGLHQKNTPKGNLLAETKQFVGSLVR